MPCRPTFAGPFAASSAASAGTLHLLSAGALFVLRPLFVLIALSRICLRFGNVPLAGIFHGPSRR